MKNRIGKELFYLALLFWCCQHDIDIASQVSGSYKVSELEVLNEKIDTSHDLIGIVTLTKTDASHVILGIDIRHATDNPTPVEALCTLLPTQNQIQLVETKTNAVLGYYTTDEIQLHSSDSKGSKTDIIAKRQPFYL